MTAESTAAEIARRIRTLPEGTMMRVLVCGGRDFRDFEFLSKTLNAVIAGKEIDVVLHGGARGADTMADNWARRLGLRVKVFPAAWKQYGNAAGPKRNQEMLDYGKPDLVVAFPGGKGTANMVKQARNAGVEVIEAAP